MPRNYHAELQSQVTADFYELVEIIEQNGWESSTNSILEFALKNNASVTVTDGAGESVFSVNSVNLASTENVVPTTDSTPSMSCSSAFQDGGQAYQLYANIALIAVSQSYGILLQLLPLIAGIILVVSVLGAMICSRYYSKPLVSISNVAKRMTTLDMTWKCEVNRKDEIGVLAASLNEMSQRLSDAMGLCHDQDQQRSVLRLRSLSVHPLYPAAGENRRTRGLLRRSPPGGPQICGEYRHGVLGQRYEYRINAPS